MTSAEMTILAYSKNAQSYEEKFMSFSPYNEMIIAFQKQFIKSHSRIIDLGCGPGNNARLLLQKDSSLKITGIDLSPAMVKAAKRNVPQGDFFVEDITKFQSEDFWDVILASFCIVHLRDEQTSHFINSLSTMVSPHGFLYLSFMEGKKAGLESTSFSQDEIFFNYYSRESILKQLEKNFWKIHKVETQCYKEDDGSETTDVFIFAQKEN